MAWQRWNTLCLATRLFDDGCGCDTITNQEATQFLLKNVYKYHRYSNDISSDCGVEFKFKIWQSLFKNLQMKYNPLLMYHIQTDG